MYLIFENINFFSGKMEIKLYFKSGNGGPKIEACAVLHVKFQS